MTPRNQKMLSKDRVIIAIDFGTTYTGVAVVWANKPEDIETISEWPGGNGSSSEKVPSRFTYRLNQGDSVDHLATSNDLLDLLTNKKKKDMKVRKEVAWGYSVLPNDDTIKCIKLFLSRDNELPEFVSAMETFTKLRKHDRDPQAATADFLFKVLEHTRTIVQKRWGKDFLETTKFEYVMTVPAMWTDKQKDATKQAAKQAGCKGTLKLISEPEAAAVHTISAVHAGHLKRGDVLVVLDAGGGTVDLISYKITKLKPLEVVEATHGTGGLCGSAFVDLSFDKHLKERLGSTRYKQLKLEKPRAFRMASDHWESSIKRTFGTKDQSEFEVPIGGFPDDDAAGIEDGYLILTDKQVAGIFDPVIDEVIALAVQQVELVHKSGETVKAVLCVGGFGQSAYLHKRLRSYFESPPKYLETAVDYSAIEIISPLDGWTSVVRGALQRGLNNTIVTERRCRYHYGIPSSNVFKVGVYPISSRYWDEYDGLYRARGAMTWYIKKGEPVSLERNIKMSFARTFHSHPLDDDDGFIVTTDLVYCAQDIQPVMNEADIVLKVCTLTSDLSSVPRSKFHSKQVMGKKMYKLDFDLVMTIDSADIDFKLQIDDETYGSVSASFDH